MGLVVATWSLLAALLLLGVPGSVRSQGCEPYMNYPNHTMCIYQERACPGFELVRSGELTQAEKDELVNSHNGLRQEIVAGRIVGAPRAESMTNMVWDDELAMIAQRAADQCRFQHDQMRNVDRWVVGQNIYGSSRSPPESSNAPNMTRATHSWFNEVYNPGFPPENIDPFVYVPGAGHYTQVAWAATSHIGCGYVMFIDGSWSRKYYFCNYGISGNWQGRQMYKVVP